MAVACLFDVPDRKHGSTTYQVVCLNAKPTQESLCKADLDGANMQTSTSESGIWALYANVFE